MSSRALTPAAHGSGREASVSHNDVVPTGHEPVGSGRYGISPGASPASAEHPTLPSLPVCASDFVKKFTTARIRLEFPEGPVPFEVNDNGRDILAKIAGLLPPGPPRP
jgi:hypothetical protein